MVEYLQHKRGKARVYSLIKTKVGFSELSIEKVMTFGVKGFGYICDVYYENPSVKIDIEVDGKVGHYGTIATRKNATRDAAFKEHGFRVVRFNTSDLIGKKKVPDDVIMAEIFGKEVKVIA